VLPVVDCGSLEAGYGSPDIPDPLVPAPGAVSVATPSDSLMWGFIPPAPIDVSGSACAVALSRLLCVIAGGWFRNDGVLEGSDGGSDDVAADVLLLVFIVTTAISAVMPMSTATTINALRLSRFTNGSGGGAKISVV
jgi:hypothetical protein